MNIEEQKKKRKKTVVLLAVACGILLVGCLSCLAIGDLASDEQVIVPSPVLIPVEVVVTATPDPDEDVAEYVNEMAILSEYYIKEFTTLDDLTVEPKYAVDMTSGAPIAIGFYPIWKSEVLAALDEILVIGIEMRHLQPPSSLDEVHRLASEGTWHYDTMVSLMKKGLKIGTFDNDFITQALAELQLGHQSFETATEAMSQFGEMPVVVPTAVPLPRAMYFCGYDRCRDSGEYGLLIFETDINIWNNPDPERSGVHHKASHGDKVTIIEEKRVGDSPGGLWYKLQSGGWANDLWLTDTICTPSNLAEYSFTTCW